jgi:hypothetical protein
VLTFTLTDTLSKNDYFQLVFPTGSVFSFVAVATINLSIFSSSVNFLSANSTLVLRQASISPTRYAGTVCRITIGRYTAPASTLPISPFLLQVYNQNNSLKMQGTASLTASPKTYAFTVAPASALINQPTSYAFTLAVQDPMLSTGMIQVTFPSELVFSVTSNCISNSNFTSPATPLCTLNGNHSVLLSNLSSADLAASTYAFTVQGVTNSDRALTTSNFSTVVYYSSNPQAQVGTSSISGVTLLAR